MGLMPETNVSSIKYLVFSIVFSLLVLTGITAIPTFARESLEKARSDYSFQFTKYRESQSAYLSAKSQYESFKTATSKNEAYLKTKDYLTQVDNLLIAYVLLLNEGGSKVNWQSNAPERVKITDSLQIEIVYFKDHQQKIQAAQTLEELPPLANELKDHLEKTTFLNSYKALSAYELTHANSAFGDFENIFNSLEQYISDRKIDQNNTVILNWRSEMTRIKEQTKKYLDEAAIKYSKTKDETASKGDWDQISQNSARSSQELKKSKVLFDEIIRIL